MGSKTSPSETYAVTVDVGDYTAFIVTCEDKATAERAAELLKTKLVDAYDGEPLRYDGIHTETIVRAGAPDEELLDAIKAGLDEHGLEWMEPGDEMPLPFDDGQLTLPEPQAPGQETMPL